MKLEWLALVKSHGTGVFFSFLLLSAGIMIANRCKKWLKSYIKLKAKDPTVMMFTTNVAYSFALIIIIISSLTLLGVPTGSLLTVLGAGSLAIALSLKDSLSHVASGLIIVTAKLFHIGDAVEIDGITGTIHQINLLNVKIKTANNDLVILPNSKVLNNRVCAKGIKGTRRIDLAIGISYDANIGKAKSIIKQLMDDHNLVLKDPASIVAVKELADSAVILAVRPWVNKHDYTTVLFDLTESIKTTLDQNNIAIPYPQVQAHVTYDQALEAKQSR